MKGVAIAGWVLFAATAGILYYYVNGVEQVRNGPHFHGGKRP